MFLNLLILFTLVPALELYLLIRVGSVIGAGNTILLIILTGATGASLARLQGFRALANIQEALNRGEMPTEAMLDGLMIFCGGVLLLTPGFLTDGLGFLLLIPLTRRLIKIGLSRWLREVLARGGRVTVIRPGQRPRREAEDADYWE